MKLFISIAGLVLLILTEILRVYFIMPFPGSQQSNSVDIAYFIGSNIHYIRLILLGLIIYPFYRVLLFPSRKYKIVLFVFVALYGVVFYLFNFRFLAETMFYQPKVISFATANSSKVSLDKLIIGIEINGATKAYPIQYIGYHHQVRDTMGNQPVMVTYCTVCRTGRVFNPFVNGKNEQFRLVGMDHFNAMFEDATTKSWWRQVSGEAVTGPLKGERLKEIPSKQMRLSSWLELHPSSLILQPDSNFKSDYDDLAKFDDGTIKSGLEKRDSSSWKEKSWVVGIKSGPHSKAYDWNELVSTMIVEDSLPGLDILLLLENDKVSFHAFSRKVNDLELHFTKNNDGMLVDNITSSVWNMKGKCISGKFIGAQLASIPAYQEFWHSWRTFNPLTLR
jgi:hypothetical protein